MSKNLVKPLVLRSFNAAGLAAGYQPINALGLDGPCFTLSLTNSSNVAVTFSFDGVNPHDYLLPNSSKTLYAPISFLGDFSGWRKGLVVSVAGAAGAGLIYLTGYYQN
jgi:hypothetical protein